MQGALSNVASLGKPVMLVPQAFGGGENWARGPSRQEERVMTYLGLLNGAKAIQVRWHACWRWLQELVTDSQDCTNVRRAVFLDGIYAHSAVLVLFDCCAVFRPQS